MKLKDSIWTLKKHFVNSEFFWLKLLFYIFSKCSDSLVLHKKNPTTTKSKTKQTSKQIVFTNIWSLGRKTLAFLSLLSCLLFLILIIFYTEEITSVLRNSDFNIYIYRVFLTLSYGNIYRNIEGSIIAVNIFSNVAWI